jgi:hypothetical protein
LRIELDMNLTRISSLKSWLILAAIVAGLAGCSGGGSTGCSTGTVSIGGSSSGSGSSCGVSSGTPTMTASISSTTVTSAAPATVTAQVLDSLGNAISGTVVNFADTATIGTLSASAALTDANGIASVTLTPATASVSGADTVTATATIGSTAVTAQVGYQINATTASLVSLASNVGTSTSDKLSAYGQSVLTLTTSGISSSAPATINVTSACVTAGKATISPASVSATSDTTTFTYKDTGGCGSTLAADTVTASLAGTSTSISSQVYLTSPTVNSITFTSATPSTIYLKGSGNVESSTVVFEVVDTAGNPLPGQVVTLTLSTFAGGVLLDQGTSAVTQTSDSNGLVSAIVNSGTVPTPVRVIATLASGVSTVSSNLAIVTGLPSQLHFSMASQSLNIEAWEHDGVADAYTVYTADRSGNPVPDGTSILFWAEGGQIQGTATTATTGGISSASASFVSAEPRPADGRVTILAYALGEESFVDLAGTNAYQAGDPFQDLGNVVKSKLYDGIYDSANDEVVSLAAVGASSSGSTCTSFAATYPLLALNNQIPNQPGTCDAAWSGKTYVRRDVETVFSSSTPDPMIDSANLNGSCNPISILPGPPTLYSAVNVFPAALNSDLYVGTGTSGSFTFLAADQNTVRINPMAVGTTIQAATTNSAGLASATLPITSGTYVYPSTSSAQAVTVDYLFASTTVNNVTTYATTGTLNITFVSKPSGLTTTVPLTLHRSAPVSSCTQ